ncbi:MAG TPA: hypothetical protein VEK80_16690 [Kribbellaceae bacterium]|nr:hypothetical protein [Kribbellaceae bacterium]
MVRGVSVTALAVAAVLVAGCGQKSNGDGTPGTSAGPSGTASGGPSGSATPSASAAPAALPDGCGEVLSLDEIDSAVGRPVSGQTIYIKGKAEPKINRIGRVTCRYGVRKVGNRTVVPLEVGVSSYSDEGSATSRIEFTVNDQRSHGATPIEVTLGDTKGTALLAAASALLIFAKGTTTVAISITKDVATGDKAKDTLTKLGTAVVGHLP